MNLPTDEEIRAAVEREARGRHKAKRLDIAAQLLASHIGWHGLQDETPGAANRRRQALEQAELLLRENEVMP